MTIWERLGISRTTDIKAIKRAYAKQLKIYHPEDDPQGYQALREAFDAALSFAKREASREEMVEYEELQGDTEPQTLLVPRINPLQLNHEQIQQDNNEQLLPPPRMPVEIIQESSDADPNESQFIWSRVFEKGATSEEPNYNTVPEFINAFMALYEHFPSRISKDKWLELLNSSVMWDMGANEQILRQLLFIFKSRKLFLPTEIWLLLENSFDLENSLRETISFEDEGDPYSNWNFYLRQLKQQRLRYDYLLKAEDLDYDQFLQLRDQGNIALSHNDLKEAESCLKQAYNLFADDPDLLRLLGNCYVRLKQYKDALSIYNQLIQMQPEELSYYLFKALSLYNIGQINPSLKVCKIILSHRPDHHGAMILLGYCYKELGKNRQGLQCFRNVLQATNQDNRADLNIRKKALNGIFNIDTNKLTSLLKPEDIEYNLSSNTIVIHQQLNEVSESSSSESSYNTVPEFIAAIIALYEHFPSRVSKEKWLELLNSNVMWNIDFKLHIRNQLMFILEDRKLFLPTEIWQLLESSFDLENTILESIDFDDDRNPNSIWSYYLRQLKVPGLRYEFLLQTEGIDYELFLQLRDQGYAALSQNDLKQAESCLKQAYAIFADDPDLLRLLGEYHMRMSQYEAALATFDHLIRLLPEETDGYLYKARIWYYMGQTNQAAEQCQFILSRWPDHYEALILLGHCFKQLDRPMDGEVFWERALQVSDRNQNTQGEQTYLPRTNRKNWKLFFNKRTLLHMLIIIVTSSLIAGCINYYRYIINENKPVTVTSLNDLELINEQKYAELSIRNLSDININQYVEEYSLFDMTRYENSAFAFRHFDQYGNPTRKVYLGEFNGQHIIVLADPTIDLLSIQNDSSIKGFVRTVNSKLESAVTEMLRWRPANPAGTPEAKLERYNQSLTVETGSDDSNSIAVSVPKMLPKYFEIAAPIGKSPVNTKNIVIFALLIVLWLCSLYYLVFEYRKIRGTI